MGNVLQFRQAKAGLRPEEKALLARLSGSLQVMWRGGWAEQGEPDGVLLLKDQQLVGTWLYRAGSFAYVPVTAGVIQLRVATADEAYDATLAILGDPTV